MSTKLEDLQGRAHVAAKDARDIAEKAANEGRSMTGDEKNQFDAAMAKGTDLVAQIKAARADESVLAQAKALADEIGPLAAGDVDEQSNAARSVRGRAKSLGLQVVQANEFKAMMAPYGDRIPEKARIQSDPIAIDSKALFIGGSGTSAGAFVTSEDTGIVETLGRRTLALRDVVSVRRTGSDTVEYVRQVSHTNAAAPVAEATTAAAPTAPAGGGALVYPAGAGVKPEGSWTYERDTAVVKTIAEWVPATKRALSDVAALEGLINDELRADLDEELEDQMVSGSGVGENFEGILSVSGTQSQAFSTDIFETVRKAITKARLVGRVNPNGIGLNPLDVETIDLARDSEGRFYGTGPFAGGPRTLWGYPIVESESFSADQAVVGDFKKAVLWDREQASVTVSDSHADFFIRNLVAILGELRGAFAVTRPSAFVLADLRP